MSLLGNQTLIKVNDSFYALSGSGGGGGGAITSITAGAGIEVDTPTGNVTISNTGVRSINAGSGIEVTDSTGDITIGAKSYTISNFADLQSDVITTLPSEVLTLGVANAGNFYPTVGHLYTVNSTIYITSFETEGSAYSGNIEYRLVYTDGDYTRQGIQTVYVNSDYLSNYYLSTGISFQATEGGNLTLYILNNTANTIMMTYTITNFSCVDTGTSGIYNNPLF